MPLGARNARPGRCAGGTRPCREAARNHRPTVDGDRPGQLAVRIRLPDAHPLDATEELPPLRVLDRGEEQTVIGVRDGRVDTNRHSEAANTLEIDARAPTTAHPDDDHLRRLAPQLLDTLESTPSSASLRARVG
jgi:hypothetical protein